MLRDHTNFSQGSTVNAQQCAELDFGEKFNGYRSRFSITLHDIPFVSCYLLCSEQVIQKPYPQPSILRNKTQNVKNISNTW